MKSKSFTEHVLGYFNYTHNDRIRGAVAATTRTFDTSDAVDVSLGRQWDRTLATYSIQALNKEAWKAYNTNGIFWKVVELSVFLICGYNARPVATNLKSENAQERAAAERLQYALDEHWNSPVNQWSLLLPDIVRDLVLFGEVVPIPFVNTLTGFTRWGFVPPESIKKIIRDPLDNRTITAIALTGERGEEIVMPIVRVDEGGPDSISEGNAAVYQQVGISQRTRGRLIGRALYWPINRSLSSARGHGDFTQAIRPTTDLVRIVKAVSERTEINNRVVSEIVFPETWTQERINAALTPGSPDYINPPRLSDDGVKIFGHTDSIKYNTILPNIGASESAETLAMLKAVTCGSIPYPEQWIFGQVDGGGLARGFETTDPAYGYLTSRQTMLKNFVNDALNFAIDQKAIFTRELDGLTDEQLHAWCLEMPEVDTEDVKLKIETLGAELNAIATASIGEGALQATESGALRRQALTRAGYEIAEENKNGKI